MAQFQNILETVGNTPVVKINKLAPPDANLYVKIEAFNPLGSVKDRLALGIIEAAERSGELKPGQTVVEATSGNTGIGLILKLTSEEPTVSFGEFSRFCHHAHAAQRSRREHNLGAEKAHQLAPLDAECLRHRDY